MRATKSHPNQINNVNTIGVRRKERKKKKTIIKILSRWTYRLAAPGALVVLLARYKDIAELTQVASDLVGYEPEDTRAFALLFGRVSRDGFGVDWWCRCVQSKKRKGRKRSVGCHELGVP